LNGGCTHRPFAQHGLVAPATLGVRLQNTSASLDAIVPISLTKFELGSLAFWAGMNVIDPLLVLFIFGGFSLLPWFSQTAARLSIRSL